MSQSQLPLEEHNPRVEDKVQRTITFGYSGDPDDAFAFYGLESGAVEMLYFSANAKAIC